MMNRLTNSMFFMMVFGEALVFALMFGFIKVFG